MACTPDLPRPQLQLRQVLPLPKWGVLVSPAECTDRSAPSKTLQGFAKILPVEPRQDSRGGVPGWLEGEHCCAEEDKMAGVRGPKAETGS